MTARALGPAAKPGSLNVWQNLLVPHLSLVFDPWEFLKQELY